MNLDLEPCRKILLEIEEKGGVDGLRGFPEIEGYDDDNVFPHNNHLFYLNFCYPQ